MNPVVQIALNDGAHAEALREALLRSGPWQVAAVRDPDPAHRGVLVVDEDTLDRLPLPLSNPRQIVLITCKDSRHLSRAWDAGIISVVSADDAPNTVILAIMAAALRVPKPQAVAFPGGISPSPSSASAPIAPDSRHHAAKRCKTQ